MKKIISLFLIGILIFSQISVSFGYNYNKIISNINLWNNSIYIDGSGIYYIKTPGGGIYKTDLNGNNEVLLANGYVDYFSGDDTYLYYRDGSNSLSKIKKDGSIVNLLKSSVNPVNIKVDNSYIFYIAGNDDSLHRINKDGSNDIIISNSVGNYNINGNFIYFVDKDVGDTIYRKNKDNTALITIKHINLPNQYWHIQGLSIDANDIFYETYNQVFKYNITTDNITPISSRGCNSSMLSGDYIYCRDISNGRGVNMIDRNGNHIMFLSDFDSSLRGIFNGNIYFSSDADGIESLYKSIIPVSNGDSNGNYGHYILNRLTATEGNMQYVNNSASVTNFSNSSQVKSNFLANYSYMQSWYESKGLTLDVINNNVDWNNGVTFSKTDVAGGMLDGYKLSAHYPFMSYKETDNTDSTIFWRTDLNNTGFQTDITWNNSGVPAYPIRNGSGGIVAYLEFPCGNLICKDQYCSDIKKIVNPTPINPIHETVFSDPGNGLPYCGDNIKNTMDEECDGNDGIRHDLGETCTAQCKVQTSPGVTPGCPSYPALGYSCTGVNKLPIFGLPPISITPTNPGGGGSNGGTGSTNTGSNVVNTGSIINWTPPGSITIPAVGDININTGMTNTEKTISDDVICSSIDEGFKNNQTIIVTNTMADTTFLRGLKGKDEFLKTLSGSSIEVADKIIQKKLKAEKLNEKSSTYDLGAGGDMSGIQFNLTKIPNSAVMRKLVDLAIDHSSTTMADYEQIIKDSCNNLSTITGKEVVPAGFIDVNEKGETILNLFRFNGE